MTKEAINPIPTAVYEKSLPLLHPEKFYQLNQNQQTELLNFYNQRFTHDQLRSQLWQSSLILLQWAAEKGHLQSDLTQNRQILSIIISNQTNQDLKPSWNALLKQKKITSQTKPIDKTLITVGNPTYSLYGIASMPNKDEGHTKPPLNLIPQAFSKWVKTIESKDRSNQILLFFKHYASFYSSQDAHKLALIINKISNDKWVQDSTNTVISKHKTHFQIEDFKKWANSAQPKRKSSPQSKPNNIIETPEFQYIAQYFVDLPHTHEEIRDIIAAILDSGPPSWTLGSLIQILSNQK